MAGHYESGTKPESVRLSASYPGAAAVLERHLTFHGSDGIGGGRTRDIARIQIRNWNRRVHRGRPRPQSSQGGVKCDGGLAKRSGESSKHAST